jgi:hypothetical protein
MLAKHQPLDQMLRVVFDGMRKDMRDRMIDSFRRGTFIECPSKEFI